MKKKRLTQKRFQKIIENCLEETIQQLDNDTMIEQQVSYRIIDIRNEIRSFLNDNGISFEEQKEFEWLGNGKIDFYLPQYKIGIDCLDTLHYKSWSFFNGDLRMEDIIVRDEYKNDLEVVKLALESNIIVMPYISDELKDDYDLMKTHCHNHLCFYKL